MPIINYNNQKVDIKLENIVRQLDYFTPEYFGKKEYEVGFTEPIAVTMIRAYKEHHKYNGIFTNEYIDVMFGMSLEDCYKGKTYTPIVNVSDRQDVERMRNSLINTISRQFSHLSVPHLSDLKKYLNHMFSELLNNVADHSQSAIGGYAMAQYYPKKRKVQFAVADCGCGFLKNIAAKFTDIDNESDAVKKALERGITASSHLAYGQERNAGYGLYTLDTILKETNGKMTIISNEACLIMSGDIKDYFELETPWEGTVVAFEFLEENTEYEFEQIRNLWLITDDEEGEEMEDFFS